MNVVIWEKAIPFDSNWVVCRRSYVFGHPPV